MLHANLKRLDLNQNKILVLPREVCDLKYLETLIADHNLLQSLPDDICKLQRLTTLVLNDNHLETVPEGVGYLSNLEHLELQNNRIVQVPSSLSLLNVHTLGLEWFMYLSPSQAPIQRDDQGQYIISKFRTFCSSTLTCKGTPSDSQQPYKTFCAFLCYFHICTVTKQTSISEGDIEAQINKKLRYYGKGRCVSQVTIQNKHFHLLQELLLTTTEDPLSRLVNRCIDLGIHDKNGQAPLMCSMRQIHPDYAKLLVKVIKLGKAGSQEVTKKLPDVNEAHESHGYPLHVAVLSKKMEVVLSLLQVQDTDASALTSFGANIFHLLLVKYDSDRDTCYRILQLCLEKGVDVNHVDTLNAVPIHIALRKKQYKAIEDLVNLNIARQKQIVNFNIVDAKGTPPLHYAIDTNDHKMFLLLMQDPFIDIHALNPDFEKPIENTVIFSAFNKLIVKKEYNKAVKQFCADLEANYIEYEQVRRIKARAGQLREEPM